MSKGICRSHIGMVRSKNQDTVFMTNAAIGSLENLYIVADGLGGHKAGEVASSMAAELFCSYLRQNPKIDSDDLETYIRNGIMFVNRRVYELSVENVEWNGMGTTFSVGTVSGGILYFGHVGDSRIYIVSKSSVKQISQDHSFVGEMVRLGYLTENEAKEHPNRNMVTRAIGTDISILADTGRCRLTPADKVLICSDGLSNMVGENDMLEILNRSAGEEEKADALINLALENGGTDNVSLVIVT